MRHSPVNYLPHIDGLRAIAVLSVVIHHLSPEILPGGFIGVDIFFVISGYLIAGIIKREIEDNNFTFLGFYERRVRRIFPALFGVLIFTAILGYFFLLPSDLNTTSRGMIGTLFFVSNLVFWRDFKEGYFAATDEALIPLVHTWSLSVEEQFYVIFPLFLFLMYKIKFNKKLIISILFFLFFLSLFLSEFFVGEKPVATFFLAPFRIWELLAGVLLVFNIFPEIKNKYVREILSLSAFVAIIYPCFFYNSLTPFPGFSALLPVIGSAMLLHFGKKNETLINSLLKLKIFVYIGLISYSLYLWHWPIIVFSKYLSLNMPYLDNKIVLFAISIIISSLSYLYIEQPFRGKKGSEFISRRKVFNYSVALVLILSIFGFYVTSNEGLQNRFSNKIVKLDKARYPDTKYQFCNGLPLNDVCIVGNKDKKPQTIFFGDSHLMSWAWAFDQVFVEKDESAILGPLAACPPFFNIIFSGNKFRSTDACVKRSLEFENFLENNENIKNIVMVGVWSEYFNGRHPLTVDIEEKGKFKNSEAAKEGLKHTIKKLNELGKNVILVGPVPIYKESVPLSHASALIQNKNLENVTNFNMQMKRHSKFFDYVNENKKDFYFIDPLLWMCKPDCITLIDDGVIYHDNNHLNKLGSLYFKDQFALDLANSLRQ